MNESIDIPARKSRRARPVAVTWLAVAVFWLAGVNAGRAGVPLLEWDLWTSFDLRFPLELRVTLSALWAIALAALAWGVWTLRGWSRRWVLRLLPVYQLYELGWQLAFVRGTYERGRLPFVIASVVVTTFIAVWILTRRRVIDSFDQTGTREENTV